MDDSIPGIQPHVSIVPAAARRDSRRRRSRERREPGGNEPERENSADASPGTPDAREARPRDTSLGRATHAEPGTHLDLTA